MIEVAVRIEQLVSSNLNAVVASASNPAKILKLMVTEIEEAIIGLSRDASRNERRARELADLSALHERAGEDWQGKAKLAMSKDREDLARGALIERDNARAAAAKARNDSEEAVVETASLRATIAQLEGKLAETRQSLLVQMAAAAKLAEAPSARSSYGEKRSDEIMDRIATLEKRADFAGAGQPSARAASLDQELAELEREAKLEAELNSLRKAAARKK